ncbi:MAG: hypothetical protein QOK40_1203 [Miltoncostaeaceae bacterium]|nr:hypothetical protein [Miltoncostaeaceae bacterium]
MSLHVGTSGWAYTEWRPAFYPAGMPESRFLDHYARVLTACEINATFYRLPTPSTVERWRAAVPESFRFAAKAHRRLTHGRTLAPDGEGSAEFLQRFLEAVAPLGSSLGALLVQLPPTRQRDDGALERLLAALPADGPPAAFEFRHESWDDPAVRDLIAGAGGTVCLGHTGGPAPAELPPGPIAYVRLRAERYEPAERDAWRELLTREAAGRPVLAFAKHEGVPAGDPHAGVGLAEWLVGAG